MTGSYWSSTSSLFLFIAHPPPFLFFSPMPRSASFRFNECNSAMYRAFAADYPFAEVIGYRRNARMGFSCVRSDC